MKYGCSSSCLSFTPAKQRCRHQAVDEERRRMLSPHLGNKHRDNCVRKSEGPLSCLNCICCILQMFKYLRNSLLIRNDVIPD